MYNKTKTILFAGLLATMMLPFSQIPIADATSLCTTLGADNSPRCYATANYSPKIALYSDIDGFYGYMEFSNDSIPNGFMQDAVWVIFSNGDILEAGMFDPNEGSPSFVNAYNGVTSGTSGTPIDGNRYVVGVYDSNQDSIWKMHSHTQTSYRSMGNVDAYTAKVGVEATHTNAPNNTTDTNNMRMHHNGSWKILSTSNVYQGWTERGAGWDLDQCGSGNERMYHINAGKGTQSC